MQQVFYNSTVFLYISFCVFIFSLGFTSQIYAVQCESGIQTRIEILMKKDFTKSLSDTLLAKESKSENIPDTMNNIRKLDCELIKICDLLKKGGALEEYTNKKQEFGDDLILENDCDGKKKCFTLPQTKAPRCTSVYNKNNNNEKELYYTKDFFEGEAALCPAFNKETFDTAIDETVDFCKARTSLTIQQSKTMVKSFYKKTSKQDDANYYSAKLLSLTERMKSLGDSFDRLIDHIAATFTQICSCGKN
jgi:hypothetical protein